MSEPGLIVEIDPPVSIDPILKPFDDLLKNCIHLPDFYTSILLKDKKCPLTFLIIKVYFGHGPISQNGVWVLVMDGINPLCFHFPLNTGVNVILNVFFNGGSLKLVTHFSPIHEVHLPCIVNFIGVPAMRNNRPPLFIKALSVTAFGEAFREIEAHVKAIYCP